MSTAAIPSLDDEALDAQGVASAVDAWLDDNWDDSITIGEWWQRLADARLSDPMLAPEAGGRNWSRSMAQTSLRTMAARTVLGPPPGLGMMLAAPTIAQHGTPEQIEQFVKPILNGTAAWCQLFSEPQAGSDLAGIQTKAEKDGDEWVITGQKVWTSAGQVADLGMLIARTDPHLPKHQGISYFAIDMDQPGVEVRPLKEMTGRSFFNEVFLEEARVPDSAIIGERGDGWRVANTTLAFERASIGAGSTGVAQALPGKVAGQLDRNAAQQAARGRSGEGGAPGPGMALWRRLRGLAETTGRIADPVIRQQLIELYTAIETNRFNLLRAKAGVGRTGGEGNIAKLIDAQLHHAFRDVSLAIMGADGMLHGSSCLTDPAFVEVALFSPAPAIYGGTDQIQRNILGERVLGLPKEPGPDKSTPFDELPRNV